MLQLLDFAATDNGSGSLGVTPWAAQPTAVWVLRGALAAAGPGGCVFVVVLLAS